MTPGQARAVVNAWGIAGPRGTAGLASARLTLGLRPGLTTTLALAGQHWYDSERSLRDAQLSVTWKGLDQPTQALRIHGGLTLPTGATGETTAFTPWSTGSVDPWASVDYYRGSSWLVGGAFTHRQPLYAGTDGYRNGGKTNLDLSVARRNRWGVAAGRLAFMRSGAGQGRASGEAFTEVDLALSWLHEIDDQWAVTGHLRVPLYYNALGTPLPYRVAVGLSVARVTARPAVLETQEHHHGDGHKH